MSEVGKYDFNSVEKEILEFWKENDTHKKANALNKGEDHFYFLDGPPYTSGRVHIGTAWNKTLKDMALRFKRMNGYDVWDRAGYDMHGMPIAQAVQKDLGLKTKEDITKYGIEKFIKKCKEFAVRNMLMMNEDFTRLGVWMDFKNAYQPIKNEYIEGEWWLIKKAHEKGRLYEGKKTMTWCGKCGTSLAKHELEYQNVTDDSIFLKFKILGSEDEYLIIWTTTPWTIPFNLGVMVNPELDYLKVKVGKETWIVAKALAGIFIKGLLDKKYDTIEEFKGKKLEGVKYVHPLNDELGKHYKELEKKSDKIHTVVMSEEYVNTTAGSGLVHMAPGCGPEDYEVGHREGIPPMNELDHQGVFKESMGKYAGWKAKRDDKKFIEEFKNKRCLIISTKVEHEYAHCWRCKEPVIFRTTTQWFFKVEHLKESMRELNKTIKWVPEFAGTKNFDQWLENLRDNGITRQRFWGTPLPVWKCQDCGKYIVIGSQQELKDIAGSVPKDLHKPWIDKIEITCECGGVKKRIPDILDVWVDSGTSSWNCLNFPQEDQLFKKMFPPDFILEGIDQIRGWFNLLFVASMVSMDKPAFKAVYMHGFVQDSQGRKMSKSLGNYILPEEVIGKYGADTLRYYMSGASNPGIDLNYNFDDMEIKFRNLHVLWNLHNYVIQMAEDIRENPETINLTLRKLDIEERYILSVCNSTIKEVTDSLNNFRLNEVEGKVEKLFFQLSRTYIQLVREKAAVGTPNQKKIIMKTIYNVLTQILKMFAVVCPMITEKMYLNLKSAFSLPEESIHLHTWPMANEQLIDKKLEEDMEIVSGIIQSILRAREKSQLGLRWPVKEVTLVTKDAAVKEAIENLEEIIKAQTRTEILSVSDHLEGVSMTVKPNHSTLGPEFGDLVPKIIARFVALSVDKVIEEIEDKGFYELDVEGTKVEINKNHLQIERDFPSNYTESEFRKGYIYLNKDRTDELDAEGFSRELMRRVQSLRKKEGLTKSDTIDLFVTASEKLVPFFTSWADQIKEKVSAKNLKISKESPSISFDSMSKEKVKGESFQIHFNK